MITVQNDGFLFHQCGSLRHSYHNKNKKKKRKRININRGDEVNSDDSQHFEPLHAIRIDLFIACAFYA